MKQAIKELEYCIVREIAIAKDNFKKIGKPNNSEFQNEFFNNNLLEAQRKMTEFEHAISVLNKLINR